MPVGDIVRDIERWLSRRVLVRGELAPILAGVAVLEQARSQWCAPVPRLVGVVETAAGQSRAGLALWDPARPGAFACVGDSSLLCCPLPSHSGPVLVSGTLRRAKPPAGFDYVLDGARVCLVSPRAPPAGLIASERGCVHEGAQHALDEVIPVGDGLCGCAPGRVSCRARSAEHCFLGGRWYAEGDTVGVPGDECEGRKCSKGRWLGFDTGCLGIVVLTPLAFPSRSKRLTTEHEALLRGVLHYLTKNKHTDLVIVGRFEAREKEAAAIARARARGARNWLLKHGAAPGRLSTAVAPGNADTVQFGPRALAPPDAAFVEP